MVDSKENLDEEENEIRGNIEVEKNSEHTGITNKRLWLDNVNQKVIIKSSKDKDKVKNIIDIKEKDFDKFMLEYRKALVRYNERKRKVDKETGSGAIKMEKKSAKHINMKKERMKKKSSEDNNDTDMEVCVTEGEIEEKITRYGIKEIHNIDISNMRHGDDCIIPGVGRINKNIERLVKVQGRLMLERQGTARESLQQPKEKEDNRFEASHREDIIITAKLNSKKCTT